MTFLYDRFTEITIIELITVKTVVVIREIYKSFSERKALFRKDCIMKKLIKNMKPNYHETAKQKDDVICIVALEVVLWQ